MPVKKIVRVAGNIRNTASTLRTKLHNSVKTSFTLQGKNNEACKTFFMHLHRWQHRSWSFQIFIHLYTKLWILSLAEAWATCMIKTLTWCVTNNTTVAASRSAACPGATLAFAHGTLLLPIELQWGELQGAEADVQHIPLVALAVSALNLQQTNPQMTKAEMTNLASQYMMNAFSHFSVQRFPFA